MSAKSTYYPLPPEDNPPKYEAAIVSTFEHDGASTRISRLQRSPYKGWRFGVTLSTGMVLLVLIINVILTVVAVTRFSGSLVAGIGTLMEGDCDAVNNWSTGLHLLINILSSLMLSASNYCMQCVAAPTRKELDRAHVKHGWLDVGILSVRNVFGRIAFSRTAIFGLLAVSSIPIHLLFNSAVFKTVDANIYDILVVNDLWLNGEPFNARATFYLYGRPDYELDYGHETYTPRAVVGYDTNYNHLRDLQSYFSDNSANASAVERLENAECMAKYGSAFVSGRSDVILVTNFRNETGTDRDNFFYYWHSDGDYQYEVTYDWMCSTNSWSSGHQGKCDVADAISKSRHYDWLVNNKKIEYCLSKVTTPKCQLQFSMQILIAVIICNALKSIAMLWTLFRQKDETIVTIGDAIASFLDQPDEASKAHAWKPPTTRTARTKQLRWYQGASRTRWLITLVLCIGALATASAYLAKGMSCPSNQSCYNNAGKSIFERGFGILDPGAIIGEGPPQRGTKGLIAAVLVANTPQLIASLLYLSYNSLVTSMLLADEWGKYATKARPLRTSTPRGEQRSTYWLSLPFMYSIPLIVASTMLHWLISQSLFLARIVVYRNGVSVDGPCEEASRLGYSVLPILLVIILGIVLLLFAVGTGWFRKLEKRMPIVGSNSMKIAAQCHPPRSDEDAAFKSVRWGCVDDRRWTFTSFFTTTMRNGGEEAIEDFEADGHVA